MSVKLRKIEYIVHMEKLDDDGNTVEELTTQQPLTIWAHQLDQLPGQVAAVVAQAEAQAEPSEPNGNRAQRRSAAKGSRKRAPSSA